MTKFSTKAIDSTDVDEQGISLATAYADSASQDKLIATNFDDTLLDGLNDEPLLNQLKPLISANFNAL